MDLILTIHSHTRWLIVLVLVIAALRYLIGWLRAGRYTGLDRGLASGTMALMGLQTILGLLLLTGGINQVRAEHALIMILALAITHLMLRWRRLDDAAHHRNNFLTVLTVMVLVYVGVARYLGWGWMAAFGA